MNVLVQAYLRHYLKPRLASYGLEDEQVDQVAEDIGHRLSSVVHRWNDPCFRDPILVLGEEEATFWRPEEVDLTTRSLVVVGVRNSLLEDLSSTPEAAKKFRLKGAILPDAEMPKLTREAIRYFAEQDLRWGCQRVTAPSGLHDVFGDLPAQSPVTWRALTELAAVRDGELVLYARSSRAAPLPIGRPAELSLGSREGPRVLSGMAEQIEPELQRMLRLVRTGLYPGIFSDSSR